MEELGSMMLKLDLRDEGEPNFTIATTETQTTVNREVFDFKDSPHVFKPPKRLSLPTRLSEIAFKQHLVEIFCASFNRFHQVVSVDEASAMIEQDWSVLPDDMLFRNLAIMAIGALYSGDPGSRSSGQSAVEIAESLVLRCLKFSGTPLTVQGLTLMSWLYLMLGNDMASWNLNCES